MAELQIQRSGLTDPNSIKAIGRATNAQYVLAGDVRSLGTTNLFMAAILNIEDASQVTGDAKSYRSITDGLQLMAELSRLLTAVVPDTSGGAASGSPQEQQAPAPAAGSQDIFEQIREQAENAQPPAEKPQPPAEEPPPKKPRRSSANRWLYLGFRGGWANHSYTFSDDFKNVRVEDAPSFEGGAHLSFFFTKYLGFQVEGIFNIDSAEYNDAYGSASLASYSIKIPILLSLSFRPGFFLISGFGGIYLNVPLGQMEYQASGAHDSYDFSVPLGFTAGGRIGINMGPVTLFGDARYSMDFGNTSISDRYGTLALYSRRILSFSAGLEFGFIKRK